jgi:lysophospholipase L1-like esterase
LKVDDGPHTLKIRSAGGGPVRVYGVVMERDVPGVVYDCLGVVGARGSRLLAPDVAHFKRQLAYRRPDLVVLLFGGNDLSDKGVSLGRYEATFRELVRRFREVRPEAACLVMSPLDHGERHRRRIRTVPRLLEMIPIQRRVAREEGCAFWSAFDAMGGEGAMGRWVKQGLGWADYAHLTAAGAERIGTLFYRALMKGLADHLASAP